MHINQVWAAYFSGTDTTKTIVTTIAQEIAQALGVPCAELNFTPPQAREEHYTFAPTDLVICGTPVIAGRVPNVLLPFLSHGFTGNHALAVPVVLFGNRNYDDALMELREILEAKLMSRKVGMTPFETLLSMYVGVQLFGIFGFLLGPAGFLLIRDLNQVWGHETPDNC